MQFDAERLVQELEEKVPLAWTSQGGDARGILYGKEQIFPFDRGHFCRVQARATLFFLPSFLSAFCEPGIYGREQMQAFVRDGTVVRSKFRKLCRADETLSSTTVFSECPYDREGMEPVGGEG